VQLGGTITYTISYVNASNRTMAAAFILDRIPTGTQYMGSMGGISRTHEGALVSWYLGNLAPGDNGTVRLAIGVPMRMPDGATILNRAWITSPTSSSIVYSFALTTVVEPTPTPTDIPTRRPGQRWVVHLPIALRRAGAAAFLTPTPTRVASRTATATRTRTPSATRSATVARTPTGTPAGPTPTPRVIAIVYDDGSAESSQSWEVGKGFAVRLNQPLTPAHLVSARFYLLNPAPIRVHVWDAAGNDLIAPFVATPARDGAFDVDLSHLGLVVSDSFYYVGFTHMLDYRPDIQVDLDDPSGYSYEVDDQYFERRTNLDYMIRVSVWYE